jgi:hypothetical protein
MTTKEQLIAELEGVPEELLQQVLQFVLTSKEQAHTPQTASNSTTSNSVNSNSSKTIWEIAEEITRDMTPEEIAQLPTDGAEQHDHYIYGTPKRPTWDRFLQIPSTGFLSLILAIAGTAKTHDSFLAGFSLYRNWLDKGYSLTDCISMQMMRQLGIAEVLTHDKHFTQEGFVILLTDWDARSLLPSLIARAIAASRNILGLSLPSGLSARLNTFHE